MTDKEIKVLYDADLESKRSVSNANKEFGKYYIDARANNRINVVFNAINSTSNIAIVILLTMLVFK